jgi:predicted ABC-type ATPase
MPERPGAERPTCRIIAGPNGAGKTTLALRYLPRVAPGTAFVNVDLIAAGLSPLAPERRFVAASRLFLREIERHVANRMSFAFETTLSGRAYLRLVRRLKEAAGRVERRFPRSLHNLLEVYAESVDEARCLLNSDPHPEMIFMQRGATRRVFNQRMYDHLVKEAHL